MILAEQTLVFLPDYRYFVVRDRASDADDGAGDALIVAGRQVCGSSGYGVYVVVAQDLLRIHAALQVWDGTPDPPGGGWHASAHLALDCPEGPLLLGSPTGGAVVVADLPAGPGRYGVEVLDAGRADAVAALERLGPDLDRLPTPEARQLLDHFAGVERYQVRVWREAGLPEGDCVDAED